MPASFPVPLRAVLLRRLVGAPLVLALGGCIAFKVDQPVTGYTCCNLRAEYGWVSSDNVIGRGNVIPLGMPARITDIKRSYYLYGRIGDEDVGFRDDSAKREADTLRWARVVIVPEDPRQVLAGWPTDVRTAVGLSRVIPGMTRAQVAMSIGHPPASETPDPNAAVWRYWTGADDTPLEVAFADDGRVARISGSPAGLQLVEMPR
jgi:hypothetical protein